MANYQPDEHDHASDSTLAAMLGEGRVIPASFSLAEHVLFTDRAPSSSDTVEMLLMAIELRERAGKKPVMVDLEAIEEAMTDDRGHDGRPTRTAECLDEMKGAQGGEPAEYRLARTLRIQTGSHETLLRVRQAIMHGHPVFCGHLAGSASGGVPPVRKPGFPPQPLEPEQDTDGMQAGLLVGYDQHGGFELVTPKGLHQVSGEWLLKQAVDLLVLDGRWDKSKKLPVVAPES